MLSLTFPLPPKALLHEKCCLPGYDTQLLEADSSTTEMSWSKLAHVNRNVHTIDTDGDALENTTGQQQLLPTAWVSFHEDFSYGNSYIDTWSASLHTCAKPEPDRSKHDASLATDAFRERTSKQSTNKSAKQIYTCDEASPHRIWIMEVCSPVFHNQDATHDTLVVTEQEATDGYVAYLANHIVDLLSILTYRRMW